ncbi:MAG: hypothetical protein HYT76_04975 [Deltaproteobacteria bacterium]|nr:hypothetical protein [Deltaproteobacteria bacterium]
MDFYGFDKSSLNLPGEKFGNYISDGTLIGFGAMGALAGYENNKTMANMYTSMADTNAKAMEAMNLQDNLTARYMAEQGAYASVENTRWQVMGMMFQANTQYLSTSMQLSYADMANRRASFNERKALSNDLRAMTLQYNAYIHSLNLEHDQSMTSMQLQHEERMAEYERPVVNEVAIDPATLLS